MTPDQIRQIAEEYIDLIDFDDFYTEEEITRLEVKRFLKFLSERYCVVERSKVYEAYNNANYTAKEAGECMSYELMENSEGQMETLRFLFGSETFNEKEE